MIQEIFKHSAPIGVTRLTSNELTSFDRILASLVLKQDHEDEQSLLKATKDLK